MHIQHSTPAAMQLLSLVTLPRPVYRKTLRDDDATRFRTQAAPETSAREQKQKQPASANIDPFIKASKPAPTPVPPGRERPLAPPRPG